MGLRYHVILPSVRYVKVELVIPETMTNVLRNIDWRQHLVGTVTLQNAHDEDATLSLIVKLLDRHMKYAKG